VGVKEPNGIWAEVSFAADAEYRSINNLGEETQKFGQGGVILDPGMVQIVAVSQYRSKRVISYSVIYGPPLPFSLASSGTLRASGSTLIGGVESASVLADGALDDEDLVEGEVVANGPNDPEAPAPLTLDSGVRLIGNARSTGKIDNLGAVVERGELKPFSEKQKLPEISIEAYDPDGKDGVVQRSESVVTEGGPIHGFHRFGPPKGADPAGYGVTFQGEVDLQGTMIFVNGDVTLEKPLKGTGALIATGKVTLLGGANMKADSLAAVVAGGDMTIKGTAGAPSLFNGLLYTEGNFALSNTRTVGAAVAAGDGTAGGGSSMTIVDSEVLASPDGADVAIAIQNFGDTGGTGMGSFDSSETEDDDPIIEPNAADLVVNGEVQTDRAFVESLIKVRYNGVTYDSLADLPASTNVDFLTVAYDKTVAIWMDRAKKLKEQHEKEPVEIVRFDLNEFLNVSDRLRSSRTFYIEG
jgi:hypothetical protein